MKFFVLLCCLFITATASAAPQPAIALHGDVKYPPHFSHFDYVNPQAPKGGELRLSAIGTFDSVNPFIIKGAPADGVGALVYETLMEQSYDEPFSMYGLIAEKIDVAADNSSVIFFINPKATWHDGKPITAQDVVWTFETLLKDGAPFYKAYYADVKKAEALDRARVHFTFKTTTNKELPLVLAQLPVLPKHYWTTGERVFGQTSLTPPLGSGPYKISSINAGQSITYKRVNDWWAKDLPLNRGRYNFDRITYIYFRDNNVALEAFFAGTYDVQLENVAKLWATAYTAPAIQDGRIIKREIANQRPSGMQGWFFNLRRPVFQDPIVRRAIAYAFDYEWSNKKFAFNAYTRTKSYFENSDLAARGLPSAAELALLEPLRNMIPAEVFTQSYEPPKTDGTGNARANLLTAAKLLDDAGYKLNKDGIRVHEKTGQRLEFEIVDNNPAFERWTLPFIQNLKRIGIQATYRTVDSAQFQNRITQFDFDMTSGVIAQSNSPGNEQREYWGSAKANTPGSRNYMGIQNKAVDILTDKIVNAKSREELVSATRALDRVLLWNYYVVPHWYYGAWRLAWSSKLDMPSTLPGSTPAILDTWWFKKKDTQQ
jgi:microcin C transport system substrate-binding protein